VALFAFIITGLARASSYANDIIISAYVVKDCLLKIVWRLLIIVEDVKLDLVLGSFLLICTLRLNGGASLRTWHQWVALREE
jgi:hypothetical protein